MPQKPIDPLAGAHAVTASDFNRPHLTDVRPFGRGGLNLREGLDQIGPDELVIATNVISYGVGRLEPRPTQTEVATSGGTLVHSIHRLLPTVGARTRAWGIDGDLYVGETGALLLVDSGYVGPSTFADFRPAQSGESWAHIGNLARMRRIRHDGFVQSIGIARSAGPVTTAVEAIVTGFNRTDILAFNSSDGSAAANWTATQHDAPQAPSTTDVVAGSPVAGNTVEMFMPGEPESGADYFATWGIARALNLNTVGARTASDEDQLHFWVKWNVPFVVAEVRLFFVVSDDFDASVVPGTEAEINTNFYMKAIVPTDYIEVLGGTALDQQAAESRRRSRFANVKGTARARSAALDPGAPRTKTSAVSGSVQPAVNRTKTARGADPRRPDFIDEIDSARSESTARRRIPKTPQAGAHEWREFGTVDSPLRRGHFERFGSTDGRNWGTVTGVIIQLVGKGSAKSGGAGGGSVYFGDMYLYGGAGPDTADPTTTLYDYRSTHFHTLTGDESNPTDIQPESAQVAVTRRGVVITPPARGDAIYRQRIYRRGGTLGTDWFFVGENSADGGAFLDLETDAGIEAAGTLELDHDQPVTTVDANGTTVLAQPVPVLLALGDLLLGLGDPYRPGHLYWCLPGESGHWPPQNTAEVCPPSEALMSGVVWGGQAYLYSRKRQYVAFPNPADPGAVVAQSTPGLRGLISRWALAVGERGIYGVDANGLWRSAGGVQEEVADALYPLFHGRSRSGYQPIDRDVPEAMRLVAVDGFVYFQYRDTAGVNLVAVYSERLNRWEGIWQFGQPIGTIAGEPTRAGEAIRLLVGGRTSGDGYLLDPAGLSDAGLAVSAQIRTAAWNGGLEREEKLLGDLLVDATRNFTDISVTAHINNARVIDVSQALDALGSGTRERYILDHFGTEPQMAFNLALDFAWTSATQRPLLHEWGVSTIPLPEIIVRRATQWDAVSAAGEKYLIGMLVDCNTFGLDLPLIVETDLGGAIVPIVDPTTGTTPTVVLNHDGRHRAFYSWPAVKAHQIRVRATPACQAWQLYQLEWLAEVEPPRIARVDSYFATPYDAYYTGLDLEIDTFGVAKTFEVYVDGALVLSPTVTASGRRVVHLTLTPGYGHHFRYVATDANDCLLYSHRWFLSEQPSEQANWNQGYTVVGTRHDKWVKGFKFEFDSFGQDKLVDVEIDGVVVEQVTVNASGRQVVFATLAAQQRGRVLRLLPADSNPSRLWPPIEVLADEEPLALTRWETQEQNYGVPGFGTLVWGYLTIRSTAVVTWTRTITTGEDGTTVTDTQTLASTGGAKRKIPVTFLAHKGLLHKDLLTAAAPFYLYREESEFWYQPWGRAEPVLVRPFGNDDIFGRQIATHAVDAATAPT